jgi:predicted DNA-binding protein (MmcQ/YjbR family)
MVEIHGLKCGSDNIHENSDMGLGFPEEYMPKKNWMDVIKESIG